MIATIGTNAPAARLGPASQSVADIQAWTCRRYSVSRLDLISCRRHRDLVHARHVAIWLCRHATPLSLPAIGRLFGGRDHTTIMHAIRCVEDRMRTDAELRAEMTVVRLALVPMEMMAG